MLERERFVISRREGIYRRYYPRKSGEKGIFFQENLSELQNKLVEEIKANPGISQTDLSKKLGMSQQRINYNIRKLRKMSIVRVKKEGFRSYCILTPVFSTNQETRAGKVPGMTIHSACPKCGNILRTDARFCDRCGKEL
ncbi:MAG: winged helix-turn-helix transcriptional regulator [Thermoplasmata archaeon]|nr:winged helix-turn-helix transcriptional regulator [Thermoplasmata archaeon]